MLMPKKDRTAIYMNTYSPRGVMVAENNFYPVNHPIVTVPNLHVIIKAFAIADISRLRHQAFRVTTLLLVYD